MLVPVTVVKATLSMEEALILKWLKSEGDQVVKNEVLLEMETDKAVVEIESPSDGVLLKILVAEGPAQVESVVGWIGDADDVVPEDVSSPPAQSKPENPQPPTSDLLASRPMIAATPAARRRAMELGISLEKIRGSAEGGRIVQEDVERAAATSMESQPRIPSVASRKVLIDRLTSTWQSMPHIHILRNLDVASLVEVRDALTAKSVSITDLILWILSRVLPRFPELTMVWEGEQLATASTMNLAFAVGTDRGVVTPVISSAEDLGIEELSSRRRELTKAARDYRLHLENLQGGVFTLTNLGMYGVDFFTPLLNAPQTAILALGKIEQAPVVSDGVLAVGWRMWANLAVDHRVADGVAAAHLLDALQLQIKKLPEELGVRL